MLAMAQEAFQGYKIITQIRYGHSKALCTLFSEVYVNASISFRFAVTPCVYLNYREAVVQVLKRTLSHKSYLDCR